MRKIPLLTFVEICLTFQECTLSTGMDIRVRDVALSANFFGPSDLGGHHLAEGSALGLTTVYKEKI